MQANFWGNHNLSNSVPIEDSHINNRSGTNTEYANRVLLVLRHDLKHITGAQLVRFCGNLGSDETARQVACKASAYLKDINADQLKEIIHKCSSYKQQLMTATAYHWKLVPGTTYDQKVKISNGSNDNATQKQILNILVEDSNINDNSGWHSYFVQRYGF